MTTDYHTALAFHSALSSANVNTPLGELDEAIGDINNAAADYQSDVQVAATVAAHAETLLHVHAYNTPNTGTADENKWSKIGHGSISARFGEVYNGAHIRGGGGTTSAFIRGEIRFRVRQQATFGNQPVVLGELLNAGDITNADIKIMVTSVAGPTTFELYLRVTRENEWASIYPIGPSDVTEEPDSAFDATFAWDNCTAFVTSPSGTGYVFAAA